MHLPNGLPAASRVIRKRGAGMIDRHARLKQYAGFSAACLDVRQYASAAATRGCTY
jgi:hypothetical protein